MNRLAYAPRSFETIHVSLSPLSRAGTDLLFAVVGYFPLAWSSDSPVRYSIEEIDGIYSAIDRPYSPLHHVDHETEGVRIVRADSEQTYPWHRVLEVWRGREVLALPGRRFEIVDGEVVEQEGAF